MLQTEARTRSWLAGAAQLAAWAATLFVLARQGAFSRLAPGTARGPLAATLLGLVMIVALWGAVRRGRVRPEALFLPALLPVLVGTALSLASGAPALGETFASQSDALLAAQQLRCGQLVDGFRGAALVISVALTALAWIRRPTTEPTALAVGFGLRAAVLLLAVSVALGWRQIHGVEAFLLLPALLGIVALAGLVSTAGRESALVFGLALSGLLLAALADPIDQGGLRLRTPVATMGQTLRQLVRYLPALVLAFGLVFARRIDAQRTLSPLIVSLAPPLVVCALALALLGPARAWALAPGAHWLESLPEGFELVEGAGAAPRKEHPTSVLLIGERSMVRGGEVLAPTQELDANADKLLERLRLRSGEPLVFAADRRVPLARLDRLLGAVVRSVRLAKLDADNAKARCTAYEIRFHGEQQEITRAAIRLSGEGCPSENPGLTVVGPNWQRSSSGETKARLPADSACPVAPVAVPLALSRQVQDASGHRMLACGYAPLGSVSAQALPPAAPPSSPFQRLDVRGQVLSSAPSEALNGTFNDAIRRCYSSLSTWPKQSLEAWLAVGNSDPQRPELWHVATGVEDEAVAHCIRGWALELDRKLGTQNGAAAKDALPLLLGYSVHPRRFSLALTTTDVGDNGWYPQVVADRIPAMLACYEPALRAKPDLEGKLIIRLDLNARHRVIAASSRQPKAMDRIAYCVAPLLQGLDAQPPPSMGDPRVAKFNIEMRWSGN